MVVERDVKRFLWPVLGILVGLIIILIIVIIAVTGNLNNKVEISLIEQAQAEVDSLDDPDIQNVIDLYQSYINKADNKTKAELYYACIDYILVNDLSKDYKDEIISEIITADNILQTSDSAVQVVNILNYYSVDDGLYKEYLQIINQRIEAEGFDPDMETAG